jgi:hypothetical protein
VKSGALVDLLDRGSVLDEVMSAARAFARRAITQSVAPWDSRSAAIVAAIAIGDRAGLTEDVQRRLQEAGTYHVIAISGGNIAILPACCSRCSGSPDGSAAARWSQRSRRSWRTRVWSATARRSTAPR